MKKLFPFIVASIVFSCEESTEQIKSVDGEVNSSVVAGSLSEKELQESLIQFEEEEKERLAAEKAKSTSLEFDRLLHDFGTVKTGSRNSTYFKVTNTGDKPLIISDVSASCGCTTPMKPDGPIAPGETDVIEVTFSPKPGQLNEIKKSVTVTANTVDKVHLLEIKAFVEE